MKVFGFLNCDSKGNDIAEVIKYFSERFDYSDNVLDRIKEFRANGVYFQIDVYQHQNSRTTYLKMA